ncbi:FAD/NAD(P)-binding protein [Halovenus salina]|uniref:FAD/NAD(P)-binding protein n=1 Tax=Halovenus salina TaxID=1510225 RepID=A0ABD5VXS6_9EURY|nr:FAD/NAD(P)-binding protein [Halovenus salina]
MSAPDSRVEWLIVGGGIHGTYLARELKESGITPDDLMVVDSEGELLASFRQKARACGMETLRSNYVQHIGPSPFGLERFAEANDRGDELVPTQNSQPRPTLDLFIDYAEYIVKRFDLRKLVDKATVTGISGDGPLRVETTGGSIRAANVVLAVGPNERFHCPTWAEETDRVSHVWDKSTAPPQRIRDGERVWVIGGGTTATQFATSVAGQATSVVLCSRSPLQSALREAEPRWLNWQYITKQLHSLPPGSQARYDRLRKARNEGTIPPYLRRELDRVDNLEHHHEELTAAVETQDGVLLTGEQGVGYQADRVVLATGFESVYGRPLVDQIASELALERGYRGMPVLEDSTLAWRKRDGECSRVFVTGRLAEGSLGAFAGNIPGARRAAERILNSQPERTPNQTASLSP